MREPSEPSMKPFSMPMWSSGSFGVAGAAFFEDRRAGRSKASHSVTRRWSLPVSSRSIEDEEVFPVGEVLDGGDAVGEGVGDG